jgi:hypothetical protein
MLHGVLMNSWDPVLGAAWQQLAGPACGPTQAARGGPKYRFSPKPATYPLLFTLFQFLKRRKRHNPSLENLSPLRVTPVN